MASLLESPIVTTSTFDNTAFETFDNTAEQDFENHTIKRSSSFAPKQNKAKYDRLHNPQSRFNTRSPYVAPRIRYEPKTVTNEWKKTSNILKKQASKFYESRVQRQSQRRAQPRFTPVLQDKENLIKLFQLVEDYSAQCPEFANSVEALLK